MYKKRIKYTDFNGVEREEDFYFNLTQPEIVELELGTAGGLESYIQTIVDTQDAPSIINMFKKIILMSYGEKSLDGKYFRKTAADGHKLADDFAQTQAFADLYMEFFRDTKSAINFVNGIVPNIPQDHKAPASNDNKVIDMNPATPTAPANN